MLFTPRIHRGIYLLGLVAALCALPYSVYVLSVGIIVIVSNWILEGNWEYKINRIKTSKSLWTFGLIYTSILIGFFYSKDLREALIELRFWLPLLLVPLVVATSSPLKKVEVFFLLILFCLSVFITTIISLSLYLRDYSLLGQNVRYLSPFILHIRLALMVNVSFFSLIYLASGEGFYKSIIVKSALLVMAAWFLVYLYMLQSLTGIVVIILVSTVLLFRWTLLSTKKGLRFSLIIGLTLFVVGSFLYVSGTSNRYFQRQKIDFKNLPKVTVNGNEYSHDTINKQYENGYLVGINICIPELRKGWEKLSKLPFEGNDKANQSLKLTLIRYLTSKGLTKDSVGLAKLDSIDVRLIENSVSSVVFRNNKGGIYPRLYQLYWEVDTYINQGIVGGSSVVQRYVYTKASWSIIKNNFFFGVGTGDRRASLVQYYKTANLNLPEMYWLNSHNQYLTVWIASGLIGLFLFLSGMLLPFFYDKRFKDFMCLAFLLICLISMFSIDLLDKHIGVSFFALFYAIFFFGDRTQLDEFDK